MKIKVRRDKQNRRPSRKAVLTKLRGLIDPIHAATAVNHHINPVDLENAQAVLDNESRWQRMWFLHDGDWRAFDLLTRIAHCLLAYPEIERTLSRLEEAWAPPGRDEGHYDITMAGITFLAMLTQVEQQFATDAWVLAKLEHDLATTAAKSTLILAHDIYQTILELSALAPTDYEAFMRLRDLIESDVLRDLGFELAYPDDWSSWVAIHIGS